MFRWKLINCVTHIQKHFLGICLLSLLLLPGLTNCGQLASSIATQGSQVVQNATRKMLTGLSKEVAFSWNVLCDANSSLGNECLFGIRLLAGTLATTAAWGAVNHVIARVIYPQYFTKGYTSKIFKSSDEENKDLKAVNRFFRNKISSSRRILSAVLKTAFSCMSFLPLIHAARAGNLPKLSISNLIRPACGALAFMAACSLISAPIGYKLEKTCHVLKALKTCIPECKDDLPENEHNRWAAAFCAHNASIFSGFAATAGLCGWMIHKRFAMASAA